MKRHSLFAVLLFIFCSFAPFSAQAQEAYSADTPTFIRDAEIEHYLRELATPIYHAADVDPDSISINIIQSNTVNAFVAEGMNEFFYTGLLQLTDTPDQLAGVIAHETGHIAGGHLIRGKEEMANASAEAILGMVLAVAAGAASGSGQLAAGALQGSQQIALRSFLSYSRSQEASADAAGMSFLDRAGISARGMLEFFQKLAGQEALPYDQQQAYVQTHPLTQDRIDAVQEHVDRSPLKDAKMAPKFYTMHERMKAKLLGYLQPETAMLRYTDNDKRLPARYALAIAYYRTNHTDHALQLTDGLIKEEPDNPFFYELKGQIEFENGRIEQSISDYKKSIDLLPDSALLRESYGHALLESKQPGQLDPAIQQLTESNRLEDHVPITWRMLASAWGRKADLTHDTQYQAMATYALAEEASAQGHDKAASQLAQRAMIGLPRGSPYWLRAQDIKLAFDAMKDKDDKKTEP